MNDATLLYVSDDPETFKQHGRLFHAPLPQQASTIRLFYDHVNGTGNPMRVLAGIANSAQTSVTIAVLGGAAGPDANFMNVGHLATLRYIQAKEVVPGGAVSWHVIDPMDYLALADFIVQPGQCIAGIYDVEIPDGCTLEMRVISCDPSHDALRVYDVLPESSDDGKQRRGVFDIQGTSEIQPIVYAGQPVHFEIGKQTRPRASLDWYGGRDHEGEYGVLKRYRCTLAGDESVGLYQSARGDPATATYLIDGKLCASHTMSTDAVYRVMSFDAEQRIVTLTTMPELNSSYPVRLSFDGSRVACDTRNLIYEA